ncbi:hypothetical protein [Frateuria sp.]|uniref:hypothetical protein n=1 Tax=Frateuria sp. TaxID=2211372 RepID=UPI003F7EF3C1
MLFLTTQSLPDGLVIEQAFSMVMTSKTIEISNHNSLRVAMTGSNGDFDELLALLDDQAPADANAIIGIQTSTSIVHLPTGNFLYVTIAGTPIVYGES